MMAGKALKLFCNLSESEGAIWNKLKAVSPPALHRYCSGPNPINNPTPPDPIPNRPLRGASSMRDAERRRSSRRSEGGSSKGDDNSFDADSILDKFKLRDVKVERPDEVPQTTTKAAEASAEPPPEADEIFKKMKETGLIPNAVAMLDGLCKDGLVQEAMKLFGVMREKGSIPEVVIYTAVVEGFCKAHKFDDAKRIFRKMQANGISPNAFTYTLFIQGLLCKGKESRLDDALQFSLEMLEAGHSPNVATFAALVDAFCAHKGLGEATAMIAKLRDKGFLVDDKGVREHLDKRGPFSPLVWEAVFGNKKVSQPILF